MPSAISCKLNSNYKKALKLRNYTTGYDVIYNNLADLIYPARSVTTSCCGIDELDFGELYDVYQGISFNGLKFKEIVAKYIQTSLYQTDKRMVFVGIPTKVGLNSQYRGNFYPRLRKVLRNFGFVETCKPYKNQNSGNKIIMMVGQIP